VYSNQNIWPGLLDAETAVLISPGAAEEGGAAAAAAAAPGGPDTRELRAALVAEVSGLAENVQEVCAMIRADTTQLAQPPGSGPAPPDSPRRLAREVLHLILCLTAHSPLESAGNTYQVMAVHAWLLHSGLLSMPGRCLMCPC
jgi:hypothetical protein